MNTQKPNRNRTFRTTLLFILTVTLACVMPVASSAAPPDIPPGLEKKLTDQANATGSVRVIVRMKLQGRPFELDGKLPDQAARGQQRARIADAANVLRGEMLPLQARINREYVTLPYMAMSVNANALEHLLRSPRIISIEEDVAHDALNASATPFVGADSTWEAGYGGKGTSVAILDTGIDNDHPYFLGGGQDGEILRIVDEACFSTPGDASLCPNSDPEYGPGSADATVNACTVNGDGTGGNICTHGTHVAGIAAGQDDPGTNTGDHDGIAPEAGVVAVQVFHRVTDCDDDTAGNQPCVRTFDSDYIAGLDWVEWFALPRHNVVSANMSLGGGMHIDPCGGSSAETAIASLRAAGVATAVAAGNDGWTWAYSSPACAPSAVTVGGVSDGDYGSGNPWVQTLWPFDVVFNMSKDVDIMASGMVMDSSEPDDTYGNKSGTSMATPQVAGAFAVIKAIDPSMTIDDVEQLLKDSGELVMDQRAPNPLQGDDDYDDVCGGNESAPECAPHSGIIKPLLQLNHAVAAITESDLGIYKDCKPDGDKLVGEEALCFLTVTNYGNDAAMEVEVTDTYISDGSADFTLGTPVLDPPDAGSCDVTPDNPQNPTGQVICDLGAMLPGEVIDITIPVNTDDPLNIDDNATVTALTPDPFLLNNASNDGLVFYEDADLQVQKICKPDGDAVVGEDLGSCEIFITNHGPSTAENAMLVDEIFSDGNYTVRASDDDAEATCTPVAFTSNVDVACDLGDMDPGEVIKVTVTVDTEEAIDVNDLATATSDTFDSDTSNNSDQGSITFIVPTADLVVTKQCQPVTPAPAGTEATCEIFVYNNGPSTAENVQLVDEIASEGSYTVTDTSTTGAVVTICPLTPFDDGDVACDLGDIDSGDTVSLTVTFTTEDEVDVNDIATATSDTYDPDPNNNTDTGSVTFQGIANLSITKTDNGVVVDAGTNLTYTIEVANAGPSTAVNVVVSDIVPAQADVVSATVTVGGGSCVNGVSGDPFQPTQCGLGDIVSGGGATIEVVVAVLPDSTGILHNDVSVSSDTYDNDNSDNQVTEDTLINVNTSLSLTKSDDADPVAAGGTLKYLLQLTNGGPSTATDVVLVDNLPPETHWVQTKVLGGTGDCLLSGTDPDVVTCTLNNMDPGESFMVVITVTVDPSVPDGTTITNNATVTESSGPGDNASEETEVNASADLWIDKTGSFLTENPSKTILYTLTVHNDSGCSGDDPQVCGEGGPSDAQNVVVVDKLPSTYKKLVVTFVSENCEYVGGAVHEVTCTTPTLAAGDTVFHEIEVTPRGRLRAITNIADVSSDTFDPNTDNNHDEMLIIVGGGGQK